MVDVSSLNAASASQQAGITSAVRPEALAVRNQSKVDEQPVKIPAVDNDDTQVRADSEDRRFARVAESAQRIINEFFPINDTRFTIFKDGSGQYITRFTNLKDGSVTFFPEPELLSRFTATGQRFEPIFETKA